MDLNKTATASWSNKYKAQVLEHVATQDQKVYDLNESNNFLLIMCVLIAAAGYMF
jgi:hypothetical protein